MTFPPPSYNIIQNTLDFLKVKKRSVLAGKVRDAIIRMLDGVDRATWDKRDASKSITAALKAHRRALQRVKDTRRLLLEAAGKEQSYLPFLALADLSGGKYDATDSEHDAMKKRIMAGFFQNKILDDSFDRKIKNELKIVEDLETGRPTSAPSSFDAYGRATANTARHLLLLCGRRPVAKHGSEWCKLAAILYGEPKKDLYHFITEVRKKPNLGAKIIPEPARDWLHRQGAGAKCVASQL